MTKQLDESYHAILEKISTLQQTIVAMKKLATTSQEICDTFDRDTQLLENDISGQLSVAANVEQQATRVSDLQTRIHDGRDKIQSLADRVDIVRQRIEGWEGADKEWQERTRRRLRSIWLITSILMVLAIAVVASITNRSADSWGIGDGGSAPLANGWFGRSRILQLLVGHGRGGERGPTAGAPSDDYVRVRMSDEM